MELRTPTPADLDQVARWLGRPEASRWLDFGQGHRSVDARTLKLMAQREVHVLRVFAEDPGAEPVGLVALSDLDRSFGTARLWCVLGQQRFSGRGLTTGAVTCLLDLAFSELELSAVNAWVVDANHASIRVLEKNHFRLIGRQRRCHAIDGISHDRLLYDRLPEDGRA
jgi:RimJ/RimL family protein N-acetyltransferase